MVRFSEGGSRSFGNVFLGFCYNSVDASFGKPTLDDFESKLVIAFNIMRYYPLMPLDVWFSK